MPKATTNSGKLYQRTRELLADCNQTDLELFEATGVTPDWLGRFRRGEVLRPPVGYVEALYEHLSGKQLALF